ncbi:MAG: sulfatase-like hydrolase/transferase [Proteobacteria bacterium]|nr:sulfatase-like hydrolase/transferase [Pseudomonadota bacterium]
MMLFLAGCLADPPSVLARFAQQREGGEGLLVARGERVPIGAARLVTDPAGCAEVDVTPRRALWDADDCRVLAVAPSPRGEADVLLLSIDTLRADHVQHSPTLSAFAETAWSFPHARSPSPWTFPAMAAVLTGRTIQVPLGPEQSIHAIPDGLAASLGLRARAVVANPHLSPSRGLMAGFDHAVLVDDDAQVVEQAQAWLDEPGGDLVLAHVMGPHLPYGTGHDGFDDLDGARAGDYPAEQLAAMYRQAVEVRLEKLAPLLDTADIVVVFSDHGEELWEHQGFEHGHALWEELLEVPVLIRAPGLEARVDPRPMRLVDIPPTLAALLAVPAPESWAGVNVAQVDPGVHVAGQLLYPSSHTEAWTADGMKLLHRPGGPLLFHLPDEITPHAGEPDRARITRLVEALAASDLRAGPSTATPTWARSIELEVGSHVEVDGSVLADPGQPWSNCGWVRVERSDLFRLEVDRRCELRIGGLEMNTPKLTTVAVDGSRTEQALREAGRAVELWGEPAEDPRLKALGYQ